VSVLGRQEAVRMDMSPNATIRDYLRGSKPKMHSFGLVWWLSSSRFKHCAMMPNSSLAATWPFFDDDCFGQDAAA
jgi:hypothetical protein